MKNRKFGITIFKYMVVVLILVYTIVLLIVTGGSNKAFNTVSKRVESEIDTEKLSKVKTQGLKRYYGLNGEDYEGATLYISTNSMSAEELLLIKVKSENQVSEIRSAIETRRDTRRHDFEGYAPDEVDLLDTSILQVRGKFVFYIVSKDAEKYKKVFTSSL